MPIIVTHPVAGDISFPDGTPDSVINNEMISIDAEFGEEYGIGETLYRAAERGLTSTARGIEQMATGDIAQGISLSGITDEQKERELRIMLEQNPLSAYSALLLGSIADPVTLPFAWAKLLKSANIIKQATARGTAVGTTGGLLEPTYEEYGDSVVMNTMFGAGLGAGLGAVAGKVLQRATEGPTVKVEGDEEGVVIPERIRQDGKLKDEVFSAIEDVELAGIEARVGQSLQESGAIEDVQKTLEKAQPSVRSDIPTPPERVFDPLARLTDELTPIAAKLVPPAERRVLSGALEVAQRDLKKAEAKLATRTQERPKATAQSAVDNARATVAKLQTQVAEQAEAGRAQKALNDLRKGRTPSRAVQTRLQELRDEAGVALQTPIIQRPIVETPQLAPEVESVVASLNSRVADRVNPIEYKPVRETTPQAQVPLGLDPRPGVGSTGTRPSQRFAATSADQPGVEAVQRATLGRAEAPVPDRAQVVGATEAERNFHSRLQAESSEQLVRLRNEQYYGGVTAGDGFVLNAQAGRYSWNNVVNAAVEVEGRILNDYDDLAEWLAENDENIFKAAELEALTPLIQEAQQRMFDSRKILFALNREGKLDSEEAVRVMQDIQYYNYIGNSAYIAQKTKIANAMTQLRKMKRYLNVQEGDLERGKQINQIMFGVTC